MMSSFAKLLCLWLCVCVALALQPARLLGLGLTTATAFRTSSIRLFSTLERPKARSHSSIEVRARHIESIESSAKSAGVSRIGNLDESVLAARKNGGYPNQAVQDAMYLNLYKNMQQKNNDDQRKAVNVSQKRRHKESLETFGLA
jgi:hypothetical protein